jgi:hypothetical protein
MSLPRSVAEILREHVTLEIEGIDRMYLNVYVPQLQREGGVASFRETPRDRNCLPMIWKSAFRKIRSPNLLTYRFFARYQHWSAGSPQTAWSGCKSLCPMSWR